MTAVSFMQLCRRVGRLGLSAVLSVTLLWAQAPPSFADSITDAAAAGEAAAAQIAPSPTAAQKLFSTDASGNVVLNPGSAGQVSIAAGQVVPGTGAVSAATLSASGGTLGSRIAVGATAQQSLASGTDASSAAYGTVLTTLGQTPPSLRTDPMFDSTRQVISNLSTNAALFGDCTTTTTYQTATTTAHVPDYQQCDRHLVSAQTVTLNHSYSYGIGITSSGSVALTACGDGCLDITLGRIGHGYLGYVPCQIFTEAGSITITNPAAITSAELINADWDDRLQIYLNDGKIWQSDTWFPPEITGPGVGCDLHARWHATPDIDVTSILRAGGTIPFKLRVSVGGTGEAYVDLRLHYNNAVANYDTWSTSADTATALTEISLGSACATAVSCTAMPPLDADGCAPEAIGHVCPSDFTSPTTLTMAAYVSPLCKQVQVSASCNAAQGAMACYTDFQGNQQCYDNNGTTADSCTALRNNPACSFVTTQCIMTGGTTNACLVAVDTYDCGQNVAVPASTTATQATTCVGPVRCMGTECTAATTESNGNFAEVAAKLQAIEMVGGDGSCADTNDPATCSVFPGKADKCKVAVGGLVNCCNKAVSVNLADYMKLIFNLRSIDSAVMKLGADSEVRGAWEMLKSPIDTAGTVVDSAWQEAQAAFTSEANAVWSSVVPNQGVLFTDASGVTTDSTAPGAISGITATITNNIAQWTYNLFGEQAANMIFSATGYAGGLEGIGAVEAGSAAFLPNGTLAAGGAQIGGGGAMIGTAITWIGAAYAAYAIATTLIQIIFACETKEYQLDTARQLKECHYIGSYCARDILGLCIEREEAYCCFDSPLARILQEQARPQLGLGWGSAKGPQCHGLTVDQLNAVDWSKVNLSEWVALLLQSGLTANAATMTAETLTGSGNALSTAAVQSDSVTTSVGRLTGTNLSTTMDRAATQLQSTVGPVPP